MSQTFSPDTFSSIDQPPPIKNTLPPVWDAVIKDMHERHEVGVKRYGMALQPFNGRRSLEDAYAELLDGAVYLKQRIQERKVQLEHVDNIIEMIAKTRLLPVGHIEDGLSRITDMLLDLQNIL